MKSGDVYSHQPTHGFCVPHKQVLAVVRLQQELWDADADRRAAVERDGGVDGSVLLVVALRVRGNENVQVSSWRRQAKTLGLTFKDFLWLSNNLLFASYIHLKAQKFLKIFTDV